MNRPPFRVQVTAWSLAGLLQSLFLLGGLNVLLNLVLFLRGAAAPAHFDSAAWISERYFPVALFLVATSVAMPFLLRPASARVRASLWVVFSLVHGAALLGAGLSMASLMAERGPSGGGPLGVLRDAGRVLPVFSHLSMAVSLALLWVLVSGAVGAVHPRVQTLLRRLLGHGRLPSVGDASVRSGGLFLERFRGAMNQARRFRSSIALMGLRFQNETGLIERRGRDGYERAMAVLMEETEKIARRGEDRIQFRAQAVLSVLFAGPEQARLAAGRFQARLAPALEERLPGWDLRLAIGIAGMEIPDGGFRGMEDRDLCERLFWAAMDAARAAETKGGVEIRFGAVEGR